MILRLLLIPILILAALLSLSQDKKTTITEAFTKFQKDKIFDHALIGFMAKDIDNNEILSAHNANISMTPASTLKIYSTASALEMLGENHRFETKIAYCGIIDENGILNGDIYIIGGGDPTLGSEQFENHYQNNKFVEKWTHAVKRAGIKEINGKIIGDAALFGNNQTPPTWCWGDISNYYGANANGLMIFENAYSIIFKTGNNTNSPAEVVKIEPDIVDIKLTNNVKATNTNSDNAIIYGAPDSEYKTIKGTIPKNRKHFKVKGSIPNSPLVVANLFHKNLTDSGIVILMKPEMNFSTDKRPNLKVLHTTYSPPLSEIINYTNHKSINIIAESCLLHAAFSTDTCKNTLQAPSIINSFWFSKGIDTTGIIIHDGSGLSRYNAFTAETFIGILDYMANNSKCSQTFINSLPQAGISGTMKNMCVNSTATGKIKAKSGTISHVKCYAGYLETKAGRRIAFCLMTNNFRGSGREANRKIEKLMIEMVESNE